MFGKTRLHSFILGMGVFMSGIGLAEEIASVGVGERSGLKVRAPDKGAYHSAFLGTLDNTSDIPDLMRRVARFEEASQRQLQVITIQSNWVQGIDIPSAALIAIYDSGRIPFLRILPLSDTQQNLGTPDPIYDLRKIAKGGFDAELSRMLQKLGQLKGKDGQSLPLIVVFGPEVNGKWYRYNGLQYGGGRSDQWGDPNVPDGPEIFRDAYRHLIDLSRRPEVNVRNVSWAMHYDLQYQPVEAWNVMENYFPGDDYIDWIGASAFGAQVPKELQWYDSFSEVLRGASAKYADRWTEFLSVSQRASKGLFEFSVIEDPSQAERKANWLREALAAIPRDFSQFKLINYWDEEAWDPEGLSNQSINSSPAARSGFAAGISDPFYSARLVIDSRTGDPQLPPPPSVDPNQNPTAGPTQTTPIDVIPDRGTVFSCGQDIRTVIGGSSVRISLSGEVPFKIYWINPRGEKTLISEASSGRSVEIKSFAGHAFSLEGGRGCLGKFLVGRDFNNFKVNAPN